MNPLRSGLAGLFTVATIALSPLGHADEEIEVDLYKVSESGRGEAIGSVTLEEHRYGVLIRPSLTGLKPGLHGFHLHKNPSCEPGTKDGKTAAAASAGGHFDPADTGAHRGPFDPDGHLGDLPALYVDQDGEATQAELAPRLQLLDFPGHALVVHEGSDNYSDDPMPLGGGKSRVACGVVEAE